MSHRTIHESTNICTALEKCVDQLRIIASLRYKDEATDISSTYQKTWNFVVKTILVLKEELMRAGSYNILDEILQREECLLKKREDLDTSKPLQSEIENLELQFNDTLLTFQKELSKKEDAISKQTAQLQELIEENARALEFERTWLRVQVEEDQLSYELKEKELEQEIIDLIKDIEEERVVHSEVMWYYENEMKETDNLIFHWKSRFQDIKDQEEKVKILSAEQEKLNRELKKYQDQVRYDDIIVPNLVISQELCNIFADFNAQKNPTLTQEVGYMQYNMRQELMDEYSAEKERRKREYEYQQFLHAKATQIQAWWRGVMVRKFIGPFRYLLKAKSNRKRKMSLKRNKK